MRNDGDYINGKCRKKIQAKLVTNGKEGLGLRVGVKKVGCLRFAYTFDYADEVRAGNQVFESHNVMLCEFHGKLDSLDVATRGF